MRAAYAAVIAGSLLAASPALAADMEWSQVDQALGKTGADQPGGVHKYALPRERPARHARWRRDQAGARARRLAGLQADGRGAMVMGDLVLTENEINPVMTGCSPAASRSRPSTTICCAPSPRPSTCTWPDREIR